MKRRWISLLLLNMWTFCAGMSEFYSSTDHMTQLIGLKKDFSQSLGVYISEVANQINLLKRAHQYLNSMTEDSYEDPEKFISNPLTAYKLVRQLRKAARSIQEVSKMNISNELEKLKLKAQLLPSDSDLDGIIMAILRLQKLYRLDPKDMTGLESQVKLDPDETFHIAEVAHQNRWFQYANVWMEETMKQLDEGVDATVTKSQVQTLVSSPQTQDHNLPFSLSLIQQSLNHENLNLESLVQRLNPENLLPMIKDWDVLQQAISSFDTFNLQLPWNNDYESLCRGEGIKMDPKRQSKLSCRYSTGGGNPHLMYAPAKEEEEWDAPLILRYHDLLSLHEMDIIKKLARPKLDRAKVSDPLTGNSMSSEVRVSKSTKLHDSESPVIARVNQRIADITGLDMETAEILQIANYGIGGQYEPHYDSKLVNHSFLSLEGKRIATVLIYMSDVKVGGATVFPVIGVSLPPKRGSAVVWFNLLKNGEDDSRTLHASCPVFIGSKWVANKWIRTQGQEFRRKCSLSKSE